MGWVDLELVLVSLAAMLSPTTLTFSVLALVLADRPLRTGIWFYLGAFAVTIAIGAAAIFVVGDVAAPTSSGGRKQPSDHFMQSGSDFENAGDAAQCQRHW